MSGWLKIRSQLVCGTRYEVWRDMFGRFHIQSRGQTIAGPYDDENAALAAWDGLVSIPVDI